MKFIFFFLISFSLQAQEQCVEPAPTNRLSVVIDAFRDVLKEINPRGNKGHEYINCNAIDAAGYEQSFRTALADNNKILADMALEAPQHPELRSHFEQARKKLECIQRKIPNLKVECASADSNFSGMAFPYLGRRIYLNARNNYTDYLESRNMGSQKSYIDYVGVVITHEAAHKCGANDASYFKSKAPQDIGRSRWSKIADTYLFWNLWGFCVPGKTCKEPVTPPDTSTQPQRYPSNTSHPKLFSAPLSSPADELDPLF